MDFLNDLTKMDWIILGVGITVGAVLMYGYNRYCPLGRIDYEESKKPKMSDIYYHQEQNGMCNVYNTCNTCKSQP